MDLVKRHESQAHNLAREVQNWKSSNMNCQKRLNELEKQREKYANELSIANGKYIRTLEELNNRDQRLGELKKQIGDVRQKLSLQKNLYEVVRTDRNLYSKNLLESNEEI